MFITLEGCEGSGKTTQIKLLKAYLEKMGISTLFTREPGDTEIGKKIRAIVLDPDNVNLKALPELLLYTADRAQHMEERIIPALKQGKVVVCDRFSDATTVYQGYVRGIDLTLIDTVHDAILKGIKPDLTILFDIDPEIGLKRTHDALSDGERPNAESRFENETLEFHKKVRQAYLTLADKEKDRFVVIDASASLESVRQKIVEIIEERISNAR